MFLHFEDDPRAYAVQTQFLLGGDMLIAPVIAADVPVMQVYLPEPADWTHLWTGQNFAGGQRVHVPAPFGEPPVFTRDGSAFEALFKGLRKRSLF